MWRHVCLRNPFPPFLLGIRTIHSPWEPQHPPALHGCIIPKFVAEKERVWSRSCGLQDMLQYTDCAPLWLLQTKLLASAGWKRGCEHFGCRCSQHVGSWDLRHSPPVLHYGCIMSIPSLQLQKKPVICREAEGLVTELWSPRFVTIQWLCSQSFYVTAANQWTIVEMELLATVGWKCGCQPFSCRCSQTLTHCRKEIYATCLSKESIPTIPCWNSKHPLATRSFRSLRAAARSNGYAECLHHACKR